MTERGITSLEFYQTRIIFSTLLISALETMAGLPSSFLRSCAFLVRMWRLYAFLLLTFPEPVSEKRFLALELDFIFGITPEFLRDGKDNAPAHTSKSTI